MCLNEITRETTVGNGRRKGEPFRRYLIDQSEGEKQRDGGCKASASACEMLDREWCLLAWNWNTEEWKNRPIFVSLSHLYAHSLPLSPALSLPLVHAIRTLPPYL